MEDKINYLNHFFNEVLEKLDKKINQKKDVNKLYDNYKDLLNNLENIFKKEQELNRQILEPYAFDFLRGMIFMKGSYEYHKKINELIGYYISNYRILPQFRKYVNFEEIEQDIKNIVSDEIARLKIELEDKNILENHHKKILNILNLIKDKKNINIETIELFKIIDKEEELDNDTKMKLLTYLFDYNNEVLTKSVENKPVDEETSSKEDTLDNNELKQKVKSIINKPVEEVFNENSEEEVELLDEEIILSPTAKSIYDTISAMISTMTIEEVEQNINESLGWAFKYFEEITTYCENKKDNRNKTILEVLNNILNKEEQTEDKKDAIIIFKGFDERSSLVEKDINSINDSYYLESVKIYLEELKQGKINFGIEAYHGSQLKGSYHKKSRKAVRLSYDILGQGIYYVYDLTIKKSDNDKASKLKVVNRKPSNYEKEAIKRQLENEETRKILIEKNEEIYNNIISYVEDELPFLKKEGIHR